jgi:hypothetical protein
LVEVAFTKFPEFGERSTCVRVTLLVTAPGSVVLVTVIRSVPVQPLGEQKAPATASFNSFHAVAFGVLVG